MTFKVTISSHSKLVIYLGPFSFPNGGAAAKRILGNCLSIREAGFQVFIASGQVGLDHECTDLTHHFDCYSLGERDSEHLPIALKRASYFFMGRKSVAWLNELSIRPYAIILYSGYSPYLIHVSRWAKRNGVRVIFDAVEWYSPPSFLAAVSPYQLNIELAMRCLIPRTKNVIAISSYLDRYFSSRKCRTVLVPPTIDTQTVVARRGGRRADSQLSLVYAGSPGKKDALNEVLEAILQLRDEGFDIRLAVAGVSLLEGSTYQAIASRSGANNFCAIDFLGSLDHGTALALVREADFSVLLRRHARFSRAGFPTKFVESLSVGTPVIANITSDLGSHLIPNVTGIICENFSVMAMKVAILEAYKMSGGRYESIRVSARAHAENAFDFRKFSSSLGSFISEALI